MYTPISFANSEYLGQAHKESELPGEYCVSGGLRTMNAEPAGNGVLNINLLLPNFKSFHISTGVPVHNVVIPSHWFNGPACVMSTLASSYSNNKEFVFKMLCRASPEDLLPSIRISCTLSVLGSHSAITRGLKQHWAVVYPSDMMIDPCLERGVKSLVDYVYNDGIHEVYPLEDYLLLEILMRKEFGGQCPNPVYDSHNIMYPNLIPVIGLARPLEDWRETRANMLLWFYNEHVPVHLPDIQNELPGPPMSGPQPTSTRSGSPNPVPPPPTPRKLFGPNKSSSQAKGTKRSTSPTDEHWHESREGSLAWNASRTEGIFWIRWSEGCSYGDLTIYGARNPSGKTQRPIGLLLGTSYGHRHILPLHPSPAIGSWKPFFESNDEHRCLYSSIYSSPDNLTVFLVCGISGSIYPHAQFFCRLARARKTKIPILLNTAFADSFEPEPTSGVDVSTFREKKGQIDDALRRLLMSKDLVSQLNLINALEMTLREYVHSKYACRMTCMVGAFIVTALDQTITVDHLLKLPMFRNGVCESTTIHNNIMAELFTLVKKSQPTAQSVFNLALREKKISDKATYPRKPFRHYKGSKATLGCSLSQ